MHSISKSISAAAVLACTALTTPHANAETVTYELEPTHTFVYFEVMHYKTATVRGRFDKSQGKVLVDREKRTGSADVTIQLTSLNSGVAAFDAMLKSDKFFDASNHPEARFKATSFSFGNEDKVQSVEGELSLRGKTKPVSLKALHFNCYQHPMLKREICGGDFVANINRRDWDISSYDVIPDDVRLVIQIEAIRQ
ncbi:YceI family protein [Diaphorobacter aerolatus]|uniref:Polyisoprenoid-binding protein n=1 Tax=Diaphorobacter aerolatus TaxID=1288495 RepID=A0A7H0GIP3_9BURK|nr:YceI family protein [Diaphorobacter aerolatus]QNP48159.1 polyisoprenoid-binding protein [Diaphorobacter aerolatus]